MSGLHPVEQFGAAQIIQHLQNGESGDIPLDRARFEALKSGVQRLVAAQPEKAATVVIRLADLIDQGRVDFDNVGLAQGAAQGPAALLNDAIRELGRVLSPGARASLPDLYSASRG